VLTEKAVPLSDEDREQVVSQLRHHVERLTPGAAGGHGQGQGHGHGHGHGHDDGLPPELALPAEDLAVWKELLDPDSSRYLGRRTDLAALSVRSIHIGQAPV
jgi:hypothetical protein